MALPEVAKDIKDFLASTFMVAEVIIPDDCSDSPQKIRNRYDQAKLAREHGIRVKLRKGRVFLVKEGAPTKEVKRWMNS